MSPSTLLRCGPPRAKRGCAVPAAAALLAVTCASTAPAAQRDHSYWNQWDDDGADGVAEGTTELALGVDYARVGSGDHTVRFAVEGEHLLRNRWGVVADVALPVGGAWVAPATLGLRLHVLPKNPFDPFVGVGGGVAWLRLPDLPDAAAPIVLARAGLAFHYLGFFFAQVSGGYDLVRYARAGAEIDRGGFVLDGRLGVGF